MNGNRCAQLTYAELSGSVRKPYIIDIGALLIPVSSFSVTDTRLGILAAYKGEGNKTWPFQDPKPTRFPELLTEQLIWCNFEIQETIGYDWDQRVVCRRTSTRTQSSVLCLPQGEL